MAGKLLNLVAVLFGATLLVTGFLRMVPGNPVDHILGDQAPEEARVQLAKDLGFVDENNQPIGFVKQYGQFIYKLSTNQLVSYRTREPVLTTLASHLPYTLALALAAMLFALSIGPLLGLLAAYKKGSAIDFLASFIALLGICVPRFFLGPLLLLLFSIRYPIFPISGASDGFMSLILPAFSLGMAMAAIQTRLTRASVLEVLSEDYIQTAKAKGLSNFRVYFKHALGNALIPLITVVGLELGSLLTGAVVTEKIFNWPGIGLLLLESIQTLDMPMVQTIVLVIAFIYVVTNLFTDLVYQWVDPRIRSSNRLGESP